MNKNRNKIIWAVLIFTILTATYFYGGSYAKTDKDSTPVDVKDEEVSGNIDSPLPDRDRDITLGIEKENEVDDKPNEESANDFGKQGVVLDEKTGKDKYLTEPVPEGKPIPVEPEEIITGDKAYTAVLSVRCDILIDNMKHLDKEKWELVPEDGVIFPPSEVIFYEGESVFNLLHREMKKNKIHFEFRNTPIYNSAYIRGISNLYELDAGELSGWVYSVNSWFPNYGCSRYQLTEGDAVEWVYTLDLGRDVSGYNVMEDQR